MCEFGHYTEVVYSNGVDIVTSLIMVSQDRLILCRCGLY